MKQIAIRKEIIGTRETKKMSQKSIYYNINKY